MLNEIIDNEKYLYDGENIWLATSAVSIIIIIIIIINNNIIIITVIVVVVILQ